MSAIASTSRLHLDVPRRRATRRRHGTRRVMFTIMMAGLSQAAAAPAPEQLGRQHHGAVLKQARSEVWLLRRQQVLTGSATISIDDKLPLDFILLIGIGLGVAVMLAIFVITMNRWSRSQSRVVSERKQAMRQLRVRGGGPTRAYSPALMSSPIGDGSSSNDHFVAMRAPSRPISSTQNSRRASGAETSTTASTIHKPLRPKRSDTSRDSIAFADGRRPRLARDRSSRSARGYSVSSISKYDIPRQSYYARPGMPSPTSYGTSGLMVPALPASGGESSASGSSASLADERVGVRSARYDRAQGSPSSPHFGGHARGPSTTLGRGTDISRNRSLKDRATRLLSNKQGGGDYEGGDPLDLRRQLTEPSRADQSRRNSTLSFGDTAHAAAPFLSSRAYSNDSSPAMSPATDATPLTFDQHNFMSAGSSSGHGSGHGGPSARQLASTERMVQRPPYLPSKSQARAQYGGSDDIEGATAASRLLASGSPSRPPQTSRYHNEGISKALPYVPASGKGGRY
ncbi:hypothetical protein IE81DRAFT_152311 [Ceraceosorus guamensis]|uniref:Uncharacterized protein n=1 Tax=Ceraceosorus guamensis TaxID=1522189 RepID=A0A316VW65_9BASI|nr:hypothetical protein IE81DRAFT_152311 [Ceraceosorus guamensis]PWN41887.1 hypothetical protein IE81DRAFT_152311 [Ceraceosorus guamensis]